MKRYEVYCGNTGRTLGVVEAFNQRHAKLVAMFTGLRTPDQFVEARLAPASQV